jgi:uroporphyrinogen-III synthase
MSRARVLNTRPREQAAELSRLLRAAGYAPVGVPAIEVIAVSQASELAEVARRLGDGEYAWIVLSSANAARFFSSCVGVALGDTPVLCGTATGEALGISPALALRHFSAQAALETLQPRLAPGARILVPRAAEGRDELISGLQEWGVIVDAPVCYRTVSAEIPPWQAVDVITLCSPSAVAALVGAWTAERVNRARVACLGATTADAARSHGVRVDAIAQSTGMPALLKAVDSVLGARV